MTVRGVHLRQMGVSIGVILIGAVILFLSARRADRFIERTEHTGTLIRLLTAQTVFSTEYAAYGYERPLRQWEIANERIHETFSRIEKSGLSPEEGHSLNTARWYYARAEGMFERLRGAAAPDASRSPALTRRTELIVDELSEHLQSVIAHAYSLNANLVSRVAGENRRDRFVIAGVFSVLLGVVTFNLFVVGRRLIAPLQRLHQGTRALSRGEFGYHVDISQDDEIGELARAFNAMGAEISAMYGRLENELVDRRRAEQALREAGQQLRLALESAEMGTWTWDVERDEMQFDDRLAAALNWSGGRLKPGSRALDLFYADDRPRLKSEVRAAISGSTDLDTTGRLGNADQGVRTISIRGRVLRDRDGHPKAVSGVAWDITDKKLVEERLQASQRALQRAYEELESMVQDRTQALIRKTAELERSNSDLEQFAYVASHDLQEPLRKISSYGELLQDRYANALDDRGRRYAGYMVDGVQRLQELIHALLDYSRLNRREEPFEAVSTRDIFERVVQDMDVQIKEAGAHVVHEYLPVVYGNAVQISQLFQNLLSNALKFRSDRPVRIRVTAEQRGPEWLIRFTDNGIGIEPEFHDRIFIVFQRLHNQAQYRGTGIGLAICKKIIERHGGRIWVEPSPGQGSTFCFTLQPPPVDRRGAKPESAPRAEAPAA